MQQVNAPADDLVLHMQSGQRRTMVLVHRDLLNSTL